VTCSLTREELRAHLAKLTARRDSIAGDSKTAQQRREYLTGSINRAADLLAGRAASRCCATRSPAPGSTSS
jgi:hypothetical protein